MPDWKRVLATIAKSLDEAAQEAQRRRAEGRPVGHATYRRNICLFWDCDTPIRADHVFCYPHFQEFQDGDVDECPGCGQGKYIQYEVCLECFNRSPQRLARTGPKLANTWYKPEYSPAWDAGDATATEFFVYILKLDGGGFYAGHSREIRARLSEHRDNRVQSTAGRHPKLVWYGTLPTREAAAEAEARLKRLIDNNPRAVRRMVIDFRDLVEELDFS